ncbi:MAG: hypothetical protein OXI30_11465, partial [Chloroflexota bacterium]|nr:hypothetical protein [Chloroflexota bacterium]
MEPSIEEIAQAGAHDAVADEEAWRSVLELCGERIRHGVASPKENASIESQVNARSYTVKQAAKLVGVN